MRSLVARMLPRTIVAQITTLIVISFVLSCTMTAIALHFWQPEPFARLRQAGALVRAATLIQLVQLAPSEAELNTLLDLANQAGISVERIDPPSSLIPLSDEGRSVLTAYFRRLGISLDTHAIDKIAFLDHALIVAMEKASLKLRMPTNWSAPRGRMPRLFGLPLVFVIIAATTFFVVLLAYAARWVIAPLSSVAAAAEAFGRSPKSDYELSEDGPHEIALVARALNEMRERIRELVERRTQMLAAIGHDLRTPLTRLRLHVEQVDPPLMRNRMVREIETIDGMLSDTLAYLKDNTHLEPSVLVDLPSLLRTICTAYADLGLNVTYDGIERATCMCRPSALQRAISNFIDNGTKYSPEVTVNLNRVEADLCIEIADRGPGISPDMKDKVFEPFFKQDVTRAGINRTGFGLGLSIARDIIQGHGGRVSLLDREPHGLRVLIKLPVQSRISS